MQYKCFIFKSLLGCRLIIDSRRTYRREFAVFVRIRNKFDGNTNLRYTLYEICDTIKELIKNCSNNVQIKIHIDHVLDEPIVIRRGNAENHVRIIIHSNGEVSHKWTKKTWATTFWDWLCRFPDSLKRICEFIISSIRRTESKIMFIDVLRLQYY